MSTPFQFTETVFGCNPSNVSRLAELSESDFTDDRKWKQRWGPITVHENCCRRYGTEVLVTGLPIAFTLYYEGTVSICETKPAGTKIYSGNQGVWRCGTKTVKRWEITYPNDPTPLEMVPWQGGNIFLNIAGPCATSGGSEVGATVDITSSSAFGASAAALQASIMALGCFPAGSVTVTALWNGGVGRKLRIDFSDSATYPTSLSPGDEWVVYSEGAVENTSPTLTGPTTTTATGNVLVYPWVEWQHCNKNGITLEVRRVSDDFVFGRYRNTDHPLRAYGTVPLYLQEDNCGGPCGQASTTVASSIGGPMPDAVCFSPRIANYSCSPGSYTSWWTRLKVGSTPWHGAVTGQWGSELGLMKAINGSGPNFIPNGDLSASLTESLGSVTGPDSFTYDDDYAVYPGNPFGFRTTTTVQVEYLGGGLTAAIDANFSMGCPAHPSTMYRMSGVGYSISFASTGGPRFRITVDGLTGPVSVETSGLYMAFGQLPAFEWYEDIAGPICGPVDKGTTFLGVLGPLPLGTAVSGGPAGPTLTLEPLSQFYPLPMHPLPP